MLAFQALHQLRNYYSLTAIIQGIRASGGPRQTLQEFGYLVNWEQNFRAYRENMEYSAALHFLLPAAIAAREGDYTVAQRAIKACEAYNVGSLYAAADNTFAETRSLSSATTVNAGGYFKSAGNLIEYSTPTRNPLTYTVFSRGIEEESRCVPFSMPFIFCCAD
jgi:hypothetical protein